MARHYYRIYIRKEALKFSAAHMTVFPDGTKERLHGHNYRTEVILDQELTQEVEPPKRDFCTAGSERAATAKGGAAASATGYKDDSFSGCKSSPAPHLPAAG
jgi:hypothetical protein